MTFPAEYSVCKSDNMFFIPFVTGDRIEVVPGQVKQDMALVYGDAEQVEQVRRMICEPGEILVSFQEDNITRLELLRHGMN